MNTTAKRFGVNRLILSDIGYTDTFSIPAGHLLRYAVAETVEDMDVGGDLSLGTANAGVESAVFSVTGVQAAVTEITVVTVTTAAVTQPGNITIAGETVAVVTDDDTVAEVAAKIAAHSFTDWIVAQGTGDDTNKVTFTAKVAGAKTNIVFEDTGGTGVTASVEVTTPGIDAASEGDILVAGEAIAISLSTPTAVSVATQIAAHDFALSGWTVTRDAATLTFTSVGEGAHTDLTVDDNGTGIAFSAVVTTSSTDHAEVGTASTLSNTAGGLVSVPLVASALYAPVGTAKTVYVNLSNGELVNNVKLYVGFAKYI